MGNALPPETYAEWLKCFEKFSAEHFGKEQAQILQAGNADLSANMSNRFNRDLVAFINTLLKKNVSRFTIRVNYLFEESDLSSVLLLLNRLRNDMEALSFYTELKFIENSQKQAITEQIRAALAAFFLDMTAQFRHRQEPELECVLYYIKRISISIDRFYGSADGKLLADQRRDF
jgi:hypothetical protein